MTDEHLLAFSLLPLEWALQQSTATGAPAVQAMTHQRRSPPWTRDLLRCLPLAGILPVLAEHSHLLDRPGRRTSLALDTVAADRTLKRTLLLDTGYFFTDRLIALSLAIITDLELRTVINRTLNQMDAKHSHHDYQQLHQVIALATAATAHCFLTLLLQKPS